MTNIINTHIRADLRNPGQSGLVIADFEYDDGAQERFTGELAPGDAAAALAAKIPEREAGRVEGEIRANIDEIKQNGSQAVPTFTASTPAQNMAALRNEFKSMKRAAAIRVGAFFSTLTDAQLRNIFKMSQIEVARLRATRLDKAAQMESDMNAAEGE